MASRAYRLRIYDTDGVTVDSTIASSQLAEVPRIPGAIARTLDGRTEAQGWDVTMLSSAIVGNLADANGRPDLGGRLCDWSESTDGGATYTVVWTGRLTGLSSPDPATFRVTLEDERWLERRSTIFTNSNTSQLYPPGPRAEFRPAKLVEGGPTQSMRVLTVDGPDVLKVSWTNRGRLTEEAAEFIRGDKIDASNGRKNQGNFTHIRININGTDREVISFSQLRMSGVTADVDPEDLVPDVWVFWPSHGQSEGSTLGGATTFQCFLHAPTAPPSDALPLHIGGTTGIDPATLAQNIYNGDYGALDEAGNPVVVRADTSALVTSTTLVWYRVTAPQNMAQWLEENIYKPLLWCPFTNADGKVVPRSVRLPQNIDYSLLTVLNAGNARFPYPDWDFNTRDAITSFVPENVEYQLDEDSPDRISQVVKARTPEDHDNIARLGRRARTVRFPAMLSHLWYARELFDRVGDGMLRIPEIRVSDSLTGIEPGDMVELDHDTLKLPSLTTNARTGASIWQVVKKDRLPGSGFGLELEYAGPWLQKLAAPTVAVAQNVDDPENSVDVSISGLLAGEGYILRVDRGDGYVIEGGGTTNETVTVGPGSRNGGCPSGTLITVAAARTKANRIRSAYATATVTTAALSAPTTLAATATNRTISLTWTNGETNFGIMPTLDGADALATPLPPGSTQFVFDSLTASTLYTVGVKHVDEFGGASTLATTTATTGTAATLSAPTQFRLTQKRDAASDPLPTVTILGTGFEVGYILGDSSAGTEVQVATDSGFVTVIATSVIPSGHERGFVRTGLRGLLYVRARHTRPGYTDSAWAATVSGYATALRHSKEPSPKDQDELPDGTTYARPRATKLIDGVPNRGKTTFGLEDTNGTFVVNRHNEAGATQSGGSGVSFGADFEDIPQVTFIPQVALVYDGATASDQFIDMKASSLTASGFTPRAVLTTAQTATAIDDGWSAAQNTAAPENGSVLLDLDGEVCYSNLEDATTTETTYTAYFDVDTLSMDASNTVTLELYYNASATGTVWTLGATRSWGSGVSSTNQSLGFSAALGANYDLRARITYAIAPGSSAPGFANITMHGEDHATHPGVQYDQITSGLEQTMTPNTGDRVAWHAMEAP